VSGTKEHAARGTEGAVIAAVALGTVLAPLNSTMIAVALPQIADDFHVSVGTVSWLVTGYLIALAIGQPLAGRIGDAVGRRRPMMFGLAGFGLASIGAAVAPSLALLIAFRIAQAVTGAVVFPNGAAVLRTVLPAPRRGRGFGILGAVLGAAAAIGPLVGGLVVSIGDWRAIFLVNIPLVAGALWLTWRHVPSVPCPRSPSAGFLGLSVFRRARFRAAAAGVALSNLAFYTTLIATPVLLADVRGWSSADVGLALAALSLPAALVAPIGGRMSDRWGRRLPAVAGNSLLVVAAAPLALDPQLASGFLIGLLVVMGCGVGLGMASLQTAAVEAVPAADAGSAAGMFSTSRYLGSIAGTLVLAAILEPEADAFRGVFVMVLAAAIASVVAVLGLPGRRRPVADERELVALTPNAP
jgi:MFS family permease